MISGGHTKVWCDWSLVVFRPVESRLPAEETVLVSQESTQGTPAGFLSQERRCGMTFTEAAAQVLRLVGKPLHYKEITDVAIEKDLLSHVGKSPEVTMGARLAALVKKGDKDNPLVRVKPGVFALREWDQQTIEKGLADRTPALQRIAGAVSMTSIAGAAEEDQGAEPSADELCDPEDEDAEEPGLPPARDELERAEIAAEADAIFAPEDDDDEPLIGGAEDEEPESSERTDREGGSKRRRRRKRKGRGLDDGRDDDLPGYTVSDAPVEGINLADLEVKAPEYERPVELERDTERNRGRDRDREGERERGGDRERSNDRERTSDRDRAGRRVEGGDTVGQDLADVLARLLASSDKNGSMGLQRLAELAQKRDRQLLGEGQRVAPVVLATLRLDNQRRVLEGRRPRFRLSENRVSLVDSLLEPEIARLDADLTALMARYAEASRRSLLKRLQDLPHRAFGDLVLLLLERAGLRALTTVRRPGTHGAELHLAGQMQTVGGTIPTAIVIRRDGREVGRERVTELRGALHHYGAASAGWIVTTGQVLSGAREEASVSGAAPVALTDGAALVALCEAHGVGMVKTPLHVPTPDLELLELLRG